MRLCWPTADDVSRSLHSGTEATNRARKRQGAMEKCQHRAPFATQAAWEVCRRACLGSIAWRCANAQAAHVKRRHALLPLRL